MQRKTVQSTESWKKILPAFLFVTVVLLQGCSFLNEILVVNSTSEVIVVRWRFGDKANLKANGSPHCYKAIVSGDRCEIKSDTLAFYCRLEGDSVWYAEIPASGALVVGKGLNQDFTDKVTRDGFVGKLEYLKILTANDKEFSCNGSSCTSSFTADS